MPSDIRCFRNNRIGNQPFITSYERDKVTVDFDKQRLIRAAHLTWPESDPHSAESDVTLIVTPRNGVYHTKQGDSPCGLSDLDDTSDTLALGPERLLLNAVAASDLHYAPSQMAARHTAQRGGIHLARRAGESAVECA